MFHWSLANFCVPEAECGVFAGVAEASFSERGLCERILRSSPAPRIEYLREITPPSVPSNPALPVSIKSTRLFSKIKLVIGAIPSRWLG